MAGRLYEGKQMKLYNHTKINDKILERLLYKSAKAVGSIRTSKVVIKVETSSRYVAGKVQQKGIWMYYEGWLEKSGGKFVPDILDESKEMWEWDNSKMINTDGGYMFLKIPCGPNGFRFWRDSLELARAIFSTSAHEWRHVRDCQKNGKFGEYNRNWKNRPHERRANNSREKALKLLDKREDLQDAVVDLGIEIERIWEPYKEEWEKRIRKAKEGDGRN